METVAFCVCLLSLSLLPLSLTQREMGSADGDFFFSNSTGSSRSCRNSFAVLETDLLSREENRYNLLRAYYPPKQAIPVFVNVTYSFDGTENETIWYWSESGLYLIQPLEILQFTSLFHSNFVYRQSNLKLALSAECMEAGNEFMELLTQRLKLYAQTSTVSVGAETMRISDGYTAVAASKEEIFSDDYTSLFVRVWLHVVFVLFPLGTVVLLYNCAPIQLLLGDKTLQKIRDANSHPRVAAMIQISVVFTVYVFVVDCFAFVFTVYSDFYSYTKHTNYYLTTVTGFAIDTLALLWIIFTFLFMCCGCHCRRGGGGEFCNAIQPNRIQTFLLFSILPPMMSGANHIPYILFSLISDPYHAGSIAMAHFISFLLFYFSFRQFYSRVALRTLSRPKNYPHAVNPDIVHFPDGDAVKIKVRAPFNSKVLFLGLIIVTPLLVIYQATIFLIFLILPFTKSVEDSPTRLYTIYQGTGILIVALLTYNIVLSPQSFSLVRMVDKLGKELHIPEKLGRKWLRLGDEEKAAVVLHTMYKSRGGGFERQGSYPMSVREEPIMTTASVHPTVTTSGQRNATSPYPGGEPLPTTMVAAYPGGEPLPTTMVATYPGGEPLPTTTVVTYPSGEPLPTTTTIGGYSGSTSEGPMGYQTEPVTTTMGYQAIPLTDENVTVEDHVRMSTLERGKDLEASLELHAESSF